MTLATYLVVSKSVNLVLGHGGAASWNLCSMLAVVLQLVVYLTCLRAYGRSHLLTYLPRACSPSPMRRAPPFHAWAAPPLLCRRVFAARKTEARRRQSRPLPRAPPGALRRPSSRPRSRPARRIGGGGEVAQSRAVHPGAGLHACIQLQASMHASGCRSACMHPVSGLHAHLLSIYGRRPAAPQRKWRGKARPSSGSLGRSTHPRESGWSRGRCLVGMGLA